MRMEGVDTLIAATTGLSAARIAAPKQTPPRMDSSRSAGDTRFTDLGKFRKQLLAIDDGVFCARREAVHLEHAIRKRTILKGGDDLAHGGAMRRQYAPDLVGHADLVKRLKAVQDVNAVVEEEGEAGGLVEFVDECLHVVTGDFANMVGGTDQPAEDEPRRNLIRAIPVLVQVFVVFEGSEDAEERTLREAHVRADVFHRERGLTVEAVQNFESTAYRAQVVRVIA